MGPLLSAGAGRGLAAPSFRLEYLRLLSSHDRHAREVTSGAIIDREREVLRTIARDAFVC